MASPGWGVGDDFEEVEVEVAYDGGRRLGMSTADICTRLKSAHVGRFEREFSDILKTYPQNGADRKILVWLAAGFSYHVAAAGLGRCYKTVKNAARRLRQFRDYGMVKLLPPEEAQTGEELLAPLPKSNAGRKPAGAKITTAAIIGFDLFGSPVQVRARKPRKMRKAAPRVRVRPVYEGQMEFAWAA